MLWLSFGRWSSAHGGIFNRYRYYYKGHWTPFVKVSLRYFHCYEVADWTKEPNNFEDATRIVKGV